MTLGATAYLNAHYRVILCAAVHNTLSISLKSSRTLVILAWRFRFQINLLLVYKQFLCHIQLVWNINAAKLSRGYFSKGKKNFCVLNKTSFIPIRLVKLLYALDKSKSTLPSGIPLGSFVG